MMLCRDVCVLSWDLFKLYLISLFARDCAGWVGEHLNTHRYVHLYKYIRKPLVTYVANCVRFTYKVNNNMHRQSLYFPCNNTLQQMFTTSRIIRSLSKRDFFYHFLTRSLLKFIQTLNRNNIQSDFITWPKANTFGWAFTTVWTLIRYITTT